MPFTPLHMGPGMVFKTLMGRRFSLVAFGVTQIVIDIEPLIGMLAGKPVLHGWTHTLLGASLLGSGVAGLGRPLCQIFLKWARKGLDREGLTWVRTPILTPKAALTGALLGAWTHVALDSLMHGDLHPWRPWSETQPMLAMVDHAALNWTCMAAGAIAGSLYLRQAWRARGTAHS